VQDAGTYRGFPFSAAVVAMWVPRFALSPKDLQKKSMGRSATLPLGSGAGADAEACCRIGCVFCSTHTILGVGSHCGRFTGPLTACSETTVSHEALLRLQLRFVDGIFLRARNGVSVARLWHCSVMCCTGTPTWRSVSDTPCSPSQAQLWC
jgi:hypothetical protein